MKCWLLIPLLVIAARAEEPKVLQSTGGSIIQQKGKIQTGSASRIEVELPYLAIARVGANSQLRYSSDGRKMILDKGTMLASSTKDSEGLTIRSGSATMSLTKGSLETSNIGGQTKVISLDGRVAVALNAKPSERVTLTEGQMIDAPAGATSMPAVETISLRKLLESSALFNMGPFPGSRAIKQNATKQKPPRALVAGEFGEGILDNFTLTNPPVTAAMMRLMELQNPALPTLVSGAVPTASQIAAFESAGKPLPKSNAKALSISGRPVTGGGSNGSGGSGSGGGGGSGAGSPPRPSHPIATPRPRLNPLSGR